MLFGYIKHLTQASYHFAQTVAVASGLVECHTVQLSGAIFKMY